MKFSEKTLKQIENNKELIDSGDFKSIWKNLKNPQLNEAFVKLGLNPIKGFTKIPGGYFNSTDVEKVEIPSNITGIGSYAFYNCPSLTNIEIPSSVTIIGSSAFYGCTSLTSIVIPNSVKSIGVMAFGLCRSLTSIEIPNSVTSIGEYTFSNCKSLTEIKFNGTKAQWESIEKGSDWKEYVPAKKSYL